MKEEPLGLYVIRGDNVYVGFRASFCRRTRFGRRSIATVVSYRPTSRFLTPGDSAVVGPVDETLENSPDFGNAMAEPLAPIRL
ncbi:MAG: hypothetical protein BJ554DRAFT_3670 [Olpidium bornovanus]|uniref:Uncharacterized protein n=1 Tax=Olpidium bornovanus TaxID=278681 RepID=A0A8H8DFH8_9FUNG|nr:MAG: hypothetical protein BJ554DRAFT_3670 [Olpidium bornovanus]